MAKFPFYKQAYAMDCGPTCIKLNCPLFREGFSQDKIFPLFCRLRLIILNPIRLFYTQHPGAIFEPLLFQRCKCTGYL